MNRPCPNKIDCAPSPFLNYSSEAFDLFEFYGIAYGADGCIGRCTSFVSQADADACALRQQVLCEGGEFPNYENEPQTCTVFCPDGSSFSYTVDAGTYTAETQELANAIAYAVACQQAELRRLCLGSFDLGCCANDPFAGQIIVTGDAQDITASISGGALPDGITLGPSPITDLTIPISGTATTAGLYNFTLSVTGTYGTISQSYDFRVIDITTTVLPDYAVGVPYAAALSADGGTDYTWEILSGSLPPGLTFNSDGTITGTPTALGGSLLDIQVTDNGTNVACHREFLISPSAIFGCCQGNLDFFPPAYSDTYNRVLDGYQTAGPVATWPLQEWIPECTGVYETVGTNVYGGAAWVPAPISKFYFGVKEWGVGDVAISIFDPSDNSVSHIGGFPIASNYAGRNCIYVPETDRVWCNVNQFINEFAIINPNDNSYTYLNNVLLQGAADYVYCPDTQQMYVLSGGSRLLKIDVNTLAITDLSAVAFASYSAVTGYTLTYVKSQGVIWYSFRGFRAGLTHVAIGMINTTTDLRTSVTETSASGSPIIRTLWYSEEFDRVLVYMAGDTYFQVWLPTVTFAPGVILIIHDYTLSWGTKGIYVAGLDEIGIVGVHNGQYCLFWFTRAEITA